MSTRHASYDLDLFCLLLYINIKEINFKSGTDMVGIYIRISYVNINIIFSNIF